MTTDAIQPVAWRVSMGTTADQNYWHYFSKKPKAIDDGEIWEPLYSASTLESLQRENEELRNGPPITGKWKDDERAKVWEYAFNKQHTRAEAAEAELKRLQAEIDRTERNRDMWKGQVDRQAAQLEDFRSETKRLQVGVYVETLPAVHLISVFADDMNERNWDDKRAYIKQQADRIRTALASTGGEHNAE